MHPELKAPIDTWAEKQMRPLEPVIKALAQPEKINTQVSEATKTCQKMITEMKEKPMIEQYQKLPDIIKKIKRLDQADLKTIGVNPDIFTKSLRSVEKLSKGRSR